MNYLILKTHPFNILTNLLHPQSCALCEININFRLIHSTVRRNGARIIGMLTIGMRTIGMRIIGMEDNNWH